MRPILSLLRWQVNSSAIILNANDQRRGFIFNGNGDDPFRRLFALAALRRRLDTMCYSIAQHVFQRRGNSFQYVSVYLAIATTGRSEVANLTPEPSQVPRG